MSLPMENGRLLCSNSRILNESEIKEQDGFSVMHHHQERPSCFIVCPLDDNKVPGYPPDASDMLPL